MNLRIIKWIHHSASSHIRFFGWKLICANRFISFFFGILMHIDLRVHPVRGYWCDRCTLKCLWRKRFIFSGNQNSRCRAINNDPFEFLRRNIDQSIFICFLSSIVFATLTFECVCHCRMRSNSCWSRRRSREIAQTIFAIKRIFIFSTGEHARRTPSHSHTHPQKLKWVSGNSCVNTDAVVYLTSSSL